MEFKRYGKLQRAGFSLVELLVVIAVIAILTGLAVPAMRGMVGASGLRGATNSITTAFDQARFAAIENATPTYLGFPGSSFTSPSNPSLRSSSFIIFRERSPNEPVTDPQFKPLSRWITLPRGVLLDLSSTQLDPSIGSTAAPILPQLDGQDVSVDVIRFDRYGKVVGGSANMTIGVGSGIVDQSGSPVFPNPREKETFRIQRLTGRLLSSTAFTQ
jgi:prepilin-type N-terminal cleavage/methylation domain-containing protein